MDLDSLRLQYEAEGIDVASLADDPLDQLERWLADAVGASLDEPNAMTLATVDADGPDARTVLLKALDERGLVFYTNLDSAKADQVDIQPRVAVTFLWLPLHRQVRLRGRAEEVAAAESDSYFAGRPRGSQISAWASPQSRVIADRASLEARVAELEARYGPTDPIPRPPRWGGYRVRPDAVEFWQGQPSRLHDRVRYRRDRGAWLIERLAP